MIVAVISDETETQCAQWARMTCHCLLSTQSIHCAIVHRRLFLIESDKEDNQLMLYLQFQFSDHVNAVINTEPIRSRCKFESLFIAVDSSLCALIGVSCFYLFLFVLPVKYKIQSYLVQDQPNHDFVGEIVAIVFQC